MALHVTMAEKEPSLRRAIQAVKTADVLATKLGITPQALSQWDRVPPLRVLDVERITGVPRHELRPDIYPTPEPGRAA
jgi:DNA-binding transcriptional regulator YdaS (Cro superfamily)